MEKHTVAVCGASGFVGSNLCRHLIRAGHTVVPLGHTLFVEGAAMRLIEALAGCDTVINVAGATIDRRWTARYKQILYDSRVGVVRRLVEGISGREGVRCWIGVSAVGYYPSTGCYDESRLVSGGDFLAGLCRAWEAETQKAPDRVRTVITRFGVVMASDGGAFVRMAAPARMGVALATGRGCQPFSWIDIDDLCRAMEWLIDSPLGGVFNLAAPQRMTQRDAVKQIQMHFGAPFFARIPEWLLRLARGEAADFLVRGQCAMPSRLLNAGFEFHSPDFATFLHRIP